MTCSLSKRFILPVVLALLTSTVRADTPANVARAILNGQTSEEQRASLISSNLGHAAEVLRAMTADLAVRTPEEYRRIPSIWKVAVAASKANDAEQLRAILDLSLPKKDEPLQHWQAVVIGGGVINGLSLQSVWPQERVAEITKGNADLVERWERALVLASAMADDEKVPHGTRYDALRMIALRPWEECKAQLVKYLSKDVNAELQQGAVSGLSDVKETGIAGTLIANLVQLTPSNRDLALRALLRDEQRRSALRSALQSAQVNNVPADVRQQLEK